MVVGTKLGSSLAMSEPKLERLVLRADCGAREKNKAKIQHPLTLHACTRKSQDKQKMQENGEENPQKV